jgi:transketolase
MTVLRPGDANETAEAWRFSIKHKEGPVALALSRQGIPTLDRSRYASAEGLHRGAYVLRDEGTEKPDIILISSGTEIALAVEAAEELQGQNLSVRVVSIPSWRLFDMQPESYRHQVLPPDVWARVAIEAGAPQGWHRYVGERGEIIGMNRFGASAPSKVLYEKFGFTVEKVVERALGLLK